MLRHTAATVLAALLLTASAAAHAASPAQVAGNWTGTVQGQTVQLILRADGSGSLNGQRGSWTVQGSQVVLDGELQGRFDGQRLTFYVDGAAVVLQRSGGASAQPAMLQRAAYPQVSGGAPAAASGATTFKPRKTLRGSRVTPAGKHVSFVVPSGWQHGLTQTADGPAYQITPPGLQPGQGAILLNWIYLDQFQASQPMTQLLEMALQNLLGGQQAERVVAPEAFQVDGKKAGRVVVTVQGAQGKVEGYLAGVLDGTVAYVFMGVYPASLTRDARPGMDTMVASFRAGKMPENTELKQRLAGRCYEEFTGSSSGYGDSHASSSTRHWFNANGSYNYHHSFHVSAGGGVSGYNETKRQGTWRVQGDNIVANTNDGSYEYAITRRGGILYLDGTKILPCD